MKNSFSILAGILFVTGTLNAQQPQKGFVIAPWQGIFMAAVNGASLDVCNIGGYHFLGNGCTNGLPDPDSADQDPFAIDVDPAQFFPAPQFRIAASIFVDSGQTGCLRLFDITANAPLPGTEVCSTVAPGDPQRTSRILSGRFSLPRGTHTYTLQGKVEHVDPFAQASCSIAVARLIAEY